ncbi:pilus assembly protein TadG-related protein [Pseudarthrobacter sp902506025]|uniref:Flp pilus assembly protein TadG n=1 Tax=Pseudarthrobacter defluvii TaxID=410837 RepID=A0ABT9UHF6_9MICC|nr:pilus assembly protein TadG-related protein [Pseudarthrobacter defluvii]MDQ0118403.1 Flp pilus assembly protein TadG [Pseudarthrobacter defluvii]
MSDRQCNTRTNDRERGAVAVISALLLVVLLGCAAIAVDVGMLYSERAQLQNGADAGAMAIAQDCAANGTATCQSRGASSALALAKQNNLQNLAATNTPTFAGSNSVTVVTKAMNHSGPGAATFFANVFGISTVNVGATASAGWGSPYAGTVALPLAFSECQFDLTAGVQVLQIQGGPSCVSSNGSGHTLPGGFGWIDSDPGVCGATITLAHPQVSSKSGVSEPTLCSSVFDSLIDQTVLLPVYDDKGGNGTNGWFHIKGFAAFKLSGFNFPGHSANNTGTPGCSGNCKGIIGSFVKYVTLDSGFTLGGPDLGGRIVALTN